MASVAIVRVTRERLSLWMVAATVAVAGVALLATATSHGPDPVYPWIGFQIATAAGAVVIVGIGMRPWPGIAAGVLAFCAASVAHAIDLAWWASQQDAGPGLPSTGAPPAFGLVFLAASAGMVIPATVLALYATAPERRLGRWVPLVAWCIVALALAGAAIRYVAEIDVWNAPSESWTWQQDLASKLDQPMLVLFVGALGLFGGLRAAARRHVPSLNTGASPKGPNRLIGAAVAAVGIIWVPATLAFLDRPHSLDTEGDGSDRWLYLPILLALVGIVASRWSRLAAWAAIAGAFQADAILTLYRAAAGVVVLALAVGPDAPTPATAEFTLLTVAGVLIQAFAFGAFALALLSVWRDSDTSAERTRWALLGAIAGIGVCAWYIAGTALTSGFPLSPEVLLLPAYPFLAPLLAVGLWRRLVPAVAEAEAVATRPFRPLRYLEVVVEETTSGGAEQRRRAVEAERARLASTLHAEFLPTLERLASQNAAGAPREEVTERLRELQDEVRRLMSERRLVILEEFGIVEALEWLVAQAEERGSFAVELTVDDASTGGRPPREVERAAFRIARLAVENAIQHAGPTRLSLQVLARPDRLTVSVADDGHWVMPTDADRRRDHVGIADMRSAANDVRGAVDVLPSQSGGTTVQFAWPANASPSSRPGSPDRTVPSPATGSAG